MTNLKSYLLPSLLLITISVTSCGENKHPLEKDLGVQVSSSSVVNGKNVSPKNKIGRSIVGLVLEKEEGQALCTGSIIGRNTILTAAHCVDGVGHNNMQKMQIVFGIDIHKTKEDFIRVANRIIIHPYWNQHLNIGEADLAVIHFAGELPAGFLPVQLADEKLILRNGQKIVMAGFGVTDGDIKEGAGRLRQTSTEIIDRLSATELVSDGQNSSVCFGDSGGPAFIKIGNELVQWGIASSVANQACNQSSVHTEIMKYLNWIDTSRAKLQVR